LQHTEKYPQGYFAHLTFERRRMKKKANKSKRRGEPELPTQRPKRTGKRGVGPKPDTEAPEAAAVNQEPSERADTETEEEQGEDSQQQLVRMPKQPTPAVQNNRMAAHFIGFVPKRTKNRDRTVLMRFSLELEDEHTGRIPEVIAEEWRHFRRSKIKTVVQDGIPSQNVELSIAADGSIDLDIVCAVPKAIISRISQKGKGTTRKIIRLEIQFLTGYSDDVEHFCHNAYDETCWLRVEESQTSFQMENDEEGDG
jgi:hypothetical protein